jgi:hypothetical protein
MIANEIAFGNSFQANIHYNLYGNKAEPNPHKCEWYVSRNMFTDDLEVGGKIMEATASESRATKPAYHFSIDWDRSEERFLSQEKCIAAADTVLEKIGLSDHQALYFWHVDADHPHMHVVVNRVHEATGKAWDMWKSKERLERATHEVAHEMEFLQVPGKHNEMDYAPDKDRQASQSRGERATDNALKPWSKEKLPDIKAEIGNVFYDAGSWDELADTLSDAGFELRSKGQGLIVTDGTNYTQLSKMGKQVRLTALEDKFGESFKEHQSKNVLEPQYDPTEDYTINEPEELPDKIDRELKRQVKRLEKQQAREMAGGDTQTNDSRIFQLMALLNSSERFEALLNGKRSATAMLTATKTVKRQQALLTRAEDLLAYHQQASHELIFASYQKPLPKEKNLTTKEKIDKTLKDIKKRRYKTRKMEKLVKILKWRKQKLEKAEKRSKRYKNKRDYDLKTKNKKLFNWQYFYRLQKMQEAKSRVTSRQIELSQAQVRLRVSIKAEERTVATRSHLKDSKRRLVQTMPKEAIATANIPWKEKKRLYAAWYAEQDLKRARERDRQFDRDHGIDLDD